MKNSAGKFQISQKFQMTFHMGSGEPGERMAKLLVDQAARLDSDPTKTLRVALRLLAETPDNNPKLQTAIQTER